MLPSIGKTDVKKAISNIRKELLNGTLPPYETASITFSSRKFKSKEINEFDDAFQKAFKGKVRGNFIQCISELLKNLVVNLDLIETSFEMKVNGDIIKDDISFYETNILRFIESTAFALKYARLLLRWTLNSETAAADSNAQNYNEQLTKTDQEFLSANQDRFLTVLKVIGTKKEALEDIIKNISNANLSVNKTNIEVSNAIRGYGANDPFGHGFSATNANVFYIFGRMYAEWQVARYDEAREERKMLEMKLMNLNLINEGKADAKLQQQIEYTADRLNKLNYKISQMEEEYA